MYIQQKTKEQETYKMGYLMHCLIFETNLHVHTVVLLLCITAKALQPFLSRMVKRGGEYRWSCEKITGGLGVRPKG